MLKILSLSIMTSTFLFFTGCGDVEDTYTPPTNPTIKKSTIVTGKTTLASDSTSNTIVCLDTNNNQQCDQNEPTTSTDSEGYYSLSTDNIQNGMLIIAKKGLAIIPFPENDNVTELEARSLKFYKSYQSADDVQNINIISTLIANKLLANSNGNYQEAIDDFTLTYPNYINSTNSTSDDDIVNKTELLLDPIEVSAGSWYLLWFDSDNDLLHLNAALQSLTYKNSKTTITAAPSRTAVQNDPDESALDDFYNNSADYFNTLDEYIEQFIQWVTSLLDSDTEDETTPPDAPIPEEPDNTPQLTDIVRSDLNGVWFIIDASGDRTCSVIESNNNISVTDADAKKTDLSLTYKQINANQASILLKLGFFTADTIKFDKYYDNETFTGNYESDGETLKGYKVDTLDSCKYDADKLGLN